MTPPMFSVITICLNNRDGLVRTFGSLECYDRLLITKVLMRFLVNNNKF